jgi:hypothetical protein
MATGRADMATPKPPTRLPPVSDESIHAREAENREVLRRARFQNLIWRQARARSTHLVSGTSGGPNAPQPDVPAEWLREYDRHR